MIQQKHLSKCMAFIAVLFFGGYTSFGQQLDFDKLEGLSPRSIGPAGMSGRITAIDVVNDNPKVMYVGAASGGVWKSESKGIEWTPVFDNENIQGIGSIAIQQSNPDVVWVGTGEGNPRNSLNGGYGIYKSLDGGKNWTLMGLEKTRNIHRIIIDPDNPNVVYAAAIGSPWGEHPERGVFKTTDGGKSWEKVLFVNNKTGAADLVMDPSNPNKLIAAMWEHRRKPYTFNSGGPGSGLYVSFDGGKNWTKKTNEDGLPKGNLGRIGLAISPSNPKVVYALVEAKKNGLYRSDDGGFKWKLINSKSSGRGSGGIGNRPFYYSDIFVDPLNEHKVYSVFTYVNVSIDGGKSFNQLMPAYNTDVGVHPDHHAWWIHPENPDFMIDGNDGGLNITYDGGKTWRFVENLPVGQFYHVAVDNEFPYNMYGGMQDNGTWAGPAYVFKSQGIRNSYWQELMFGDGFDVVPDPKDNRYGYAMSQQGYVGRYDRQTGSTRMIRPTHPDPDVKLRFNWNSAIAIDPFDQKTIYFGSQFVHRSSNQGYEWEIISPDLTTNDPEKQKQYESGGLTMDATGAENYCTVLAISPSPIEQGVIWVGTDDGRIQLTRDGGKEWTDVSPGSKIFPKDGWVAQIKASEHNKGEAYAVVNNYRNFDFKPYLFRTRNYGKSWESLLSEKDETFGYSLSFVQDPVVPQLVFLGTENGLYLSLDEGASWQKWTKNYPSVPTMDMVIHPREHDLNIATFGRSFWVFDDIRPLREMAKEGAELVDKNLHVFEAPAAYLAYNQQPTGSRFGANATYNGENRPRGAMISYVFNKEKPAEGAKEKKDKKKSGDSIKMMVYNDQNELIRTIKSKAPKENGIHRTFWYMREKGVSRPSRKESKSKREPSGVGVLPGSYKVVMHYKAHKDSTTVVVKSDPRVSLNQQGMVAKYEFQKEIELQMAKAALATKQLRESLEAVKGVKSLAKSMDKEANKELIKTCDSVSKQLNGFMDDIMGKEDKRQGITSSKDPSTISYLYTASGYARSLQQAPGSREKQLLENADSKLQPVIDSINEFYTKDWPVFQQTVKEASLSPFKDVEKIE